jgi:hypothetical protein
MSGEMLAREEEGKVKIDDRPELVGNYTLGRLVMMGNLRIDYDWLSFVLWRRSFERTDTYHRR